MMRVLIPFMFLAGCGIPGWPVSPHVAATSSYAAHGARDGVAWVVARHTLITAEEVCRGAASVVLDVGDGHETALVRRIDGGLCLLALVPVGEVHDETGALVSETYTPLGPPLRISRRRPLPASHPKFHPGEPGAPLIVVGMWGQDYDGGGSYGYGVDGVHVVDGIVTLASLRRFVRTSGITARQEPCCIDDDIGRLGNLPDDHQEQESGDAYNPDWTRNPGGASQ